MTHYCVCEACNKLTEVDTSKVKIGPNLKTYVTALNYLRTPCIYCGKDAYAIFRG